MRVGRSLVMLNGEGLRGWVVLVWGGVLVVIRGLGESSLFIA